MRPTRLPATGPDESATAPRVGRRPVTSHAVVEAAAFELFARNGFDDTTIQAIADACGIGRRTVFRYFGSKDDIPWGRFDDSLVHLRAVLDATPADLPLHEAVHRAVLDFNALAPDAVPQHRARMALILRTPALQAHSALRYAGWRAVIEDFVARRERTSPGSLLPTVVGHVALALALSAYERWLEVEDAELAVLLDEALAQLRRYLDTAGSGDVRSVERPVSGHPAGSPGATLASPTPTKESA